jgi:O-antigen/teichoic acid export membrane protein
LLYAARVLGKAPYGQYATIQAAINVFSLVGAVGFGTTAARYISHLREHDRPRAGRIAGLLFAAAVLCGWLAAVALWLLSPMVPAYTDTFASLTRWSAVAVLMYSVDGVVTGILSGLENFRALAFVSALQGLTIIVATVVLTPAFGVQGAVAALVLSATVAAGMDCAILSREIRHSRAPFSLLGALGERRVLVEFSLPTILNSVTLSGSYLLSLSLIGASSAGAAAAGVFGLGRQIGMWVQVAPQILLRATLPVLSERLAADRGSVSRIVRTTHGLYMLSCFPLCAMAVCAAQPLLALAAPAFREDRLAITALIVASAFGVARGASELLLVADGRAWTNVCLSALWNVVMLAGALVTYKGGPVTVVSYATALGLLLAAAIGNRLVRVPGGWSPLRTDLCMILLMGIAAVSRRVSLTPMVPLVGMAIGICCYRWFLPAPVRASLRQRVGLKPAGETGC